jgi:hypothetical protein
MKSSAMLLVIGGRCLTSPAEVRQTAGGRSGSDCVEQVLD